MKPVKHLRKKVADVLHSYGLGYLQMTEKGPANSLTVIFDHQTNSSKLKTLDYSLKAQKLKAAWSFSPETWELSVTISQ